MNIIPYKKTYMRGYNMAKLYYKIKSTLDKRKVDNYSEQALVRFYNTIKHKDTYIKLLKTGQQCNKEYDRFSLDTFNCCHNYALKIDDIETCEEGLEILVDNYKRISVSQLRRGDIVTFFSDDYLYKDNKSKDISIDNVWHFGIIKRTDGTLKGTIITSKWGRYGIFETNLYSLPYFYGSKVCFWRKRRLI